ncbi:zinc ribbon domain-containing protein [Streptomyces sparsogenes]|uniref:Zn-ribbon domain-containing OB-fold protein n=1 Tax=Streptomyces sparsogenes TaxID=67365 RepID=UPI0009A1F5AB
MHATTAVRRAPAVTGEPPPPVTGRFGPGTERDTVLHTVIETMDSAPVEREVDPSVSPLPEADCPTQVPLGGVGGGELYFQRCRWCRTAVFRRLLCPVCASTDFAWELSRGTGVIRHVLAVRRSPGRQCALATINVDEGFWLCSRVIGVPPLIVRVGAPVCLAEGIESGPQGLLFRLCEPPQPPSR